MGRPQVPLDRDGSPVREFAFWLRDLRNRSGLTYEQIAKITHYGTSTLQAATSGERLPTLKVVVAFVEACDGDVSAWRTYWTQLRRILDPYAPTDATRSAIPSWAASNGANVTDLPVPTLPVPTAPGDQADQDPSVQALDKDGWYIESFKALLRLDVDPVEAIEQRVIVATRDGVDELATTICVPRHQDDEGASHQLDAELLHGGSLVLREQPYETFFRNVIALPNPLRAGERHEYAMRLRLPPGQPMAAHYVHVPFRRSDSFELRVRFSGVRLPLAVWRVSGVPNTVIYERRPPTETISPDIFGEVHVAFQEMRVGFGYGICWLDDQISDIAS
ncbi:MAG TPA: helix-turn-helix transcriptional regulator [Streptosporangiaceae bacterium]|jgi:transcriptional regulator with XRE-family HTH domain|nr:helix-turn-helix transcriptional regulator [Streptosporangiaceae bacterium]